MLWEKTTTKQVLHLKTSLIEQISHPIVSSFLLVSFFSGFKWRLHWHQRNLPSWCLSKVISVFMCFQWLEVGNPPTHHPVAHFDTLCPTAVLTAKASPASELATASCTSDKVVPDGAATCLEDSNQTNLLSCCTFRKATFIKKHLVLLVTFNHSLV